MKYEPKEVKNMTFKELEVRTNQDIAKKASTFGASCLTDAELLSAALQIPLENAMRLMCLSENDLRLLPVKTKEELKASSGITERQEIRLRAMFELSRRLNTGCFKEGIKIESPGDVGMYFASEMSLLTHEELWTAMLNSHLKLIKLEKVSMGGLCSTAATPREIFNQPIRRGAHCIIVVHNHPSGCLDPSESDISLTKVLSDAGKLLGIELLDHLIVGGGCYLSMKEQGLLM